MNFNFQSAFQCVQLHGKLTSVEQFRRHVIQHEPFHLRDEINYIKPLGYMKNLKVCLI